MITFSKSSGDSLLRQNMREQRVGRSIKLWRRNDVVPQLGDVDERIVNSRHSRANAQSFHTAFQRSHSLFQHRVSWIADASVNVPLNFQVEERCAMSGVVKFKRDGLVDRYGYSFGGGVAIVACVKCDGLSLHDLFRNGRDAGRSNGRRIPRE